MILNNGSVPKSNFNSHQGGRAGQDNMYRPYQTQRRQHNSQMNSNQHFRSQESKSGPYPRNDQAYSRPLPQRKQLYDPSSNGSSAQHRSRNANQNTFASTQAQIGYLDLAVHLVVPRVQMSVEEYEEKERLRSVLEKICQHAVFESEKSRRGPHFKAESVELRCFGSMSTTFATKASDMDLVLVSPLSEAATPGSETPRIIEKALLESGYGVRLLTKTRVPIIRFCEKPTPDLRDLLLKERTKYENEQDALPPAGAKKSDKKGKNSKKERPDPTLPQNRSDNPPVLDAKPGKTDSLNSAKIEPQDAKDNADLGEDDVVSPKDNLESDEKPQCHGDNSSVSSNTERDDPNLLTKTDDERAKLYPLAIQEGWYETTERGVINKYLSVIKKTNATEDEKSEARKLLLDLPNVIGKYRPPPEAHPLEFPKSGVGIQCDINFSNQLALHNSHLLKCYSLCDQRVREMVLFVKAWSKKRKINSSYHGTLSSYGYVLMVLHYLVNVAQPPVLLNLQQTPLAFEDEMSAKIVELDGHNIQFLRNEAAIEVLRKRQDPQHRNIETVGSLLRGFFHYFAQQGHRSPFGGFAWSMDVLSLRTLGGLLPKQAKGWTGAKTETIELKGPGPKQTKDVRQRYLFAIEDPFETEHNIARTVVHNGIVAIRDEFRRAHRLIEHAGIMPGTQMEDLLEEAEDRENLQYRAFGPRPRNGPDSKSNGRSNGDKRAAAGPNPTSVKK